MPRRLRLCRPVPACLVIGLLGQSASAQIIDENSNFSITAPAAPRMEAGIDLNSDLRYGFNALSRSNLPGGLEVDPVADTVWVKGVSGYVARPVAKNLAVVASASFNHINYFDHSQLNFFNARGSVGLLFMPSGATSLYAGGACSVELEEKSFKSYYDHCGPTAVLRTRLGSARKFHANLQVSGYMALGDSNRLARYREASARLSLTTGGPLLLAVEPGGYVRDFTRPAFIPAAFTYERTDYGLSVPVSLIYRHRRWQAGLVAEPNVNWSTDPNFRNWDVRVGPTVKVSF